MDIIDLIIWIAVAVLVAWIIWVLVNAIMNEMKAAEFPRRVVRVAMLLIALVIVLLVAFGRVHLPHLAILG